MPKLEPTYLRYVYDGLKKGSLNAENAAALPQGFIGLYEQEFTQKTPANEREKVLNQLALWALFKGPVSANLAADVLQIEEGQIKDLIDLYSSWFNSPESGKYQLYHERLRVYLLQKLKADEVQAINEKLISFLEDVIKQAKEEEAEYYALKHLHQHMALESQLGNHYERLHSYVNQESLWRRQIQLSKSYAWSQNAVQQGIKEGARRQHEMNTIRSTVNSVKLMTQEQNSAEDILNLLNEGDYITALKRAESWEGERQFKLYLLMLHELTIGASKEAESRKEACKAILEAIGQTPEDHSVLNWVVFYPEFAVYKYDVELQKMEMDGMVIWKRANYILESILQQKEINLSLIKKLADLIPNKSDKSVAYLAISKAFIERGQKEEALKVVDEIEHLWDKCAAYCTISGFLMEQGEKEEAKKVIKKAPIVADKITFPYRRSYAYSSISTVLLRQGETKEASKALKEAHIVIDKITSPSSRCEAYVAVYKVLMEQGEKVEAKKAMKEALKIASQIEGDWGKAKAYSKILKVLAELGNIIEGKKIAGKIEHSKGRAQACILLVKPLVEQGNISEVFQIASGIKHPREKSKAYTEIAKVLMKQAKKDLASKAINNALQVAEGIPSASLVGAISLKSVVYGEIAKMLHEQGQKKDAQKALKQSLNIASEISDNLYDDKYRAIAKNLLKQGNKRESLKMVKKIGHTRLSSIVHSEIAMILFEQKNKEEAKRVMNEALQIASEIKDPKFKFIEYSKIAKMLFEQDNKEEAKKVMYEVFIIASQITTVDQKSYCNRNFAKLLFEQGNKVDAQKVMNIALIISSEITHPNTKSIALSEIAKIYLEHGYEEEAFNTSSKIKGPWGRSFAYSEMAQVFFKQGNVSEAFQIASQIEHPREQTIAYSEIAKLNFGQCNKIEAKKNIKDALTIALNISHAKDKSKAYSAISKLLMEQGEKKESFQLAEQIMMGSERNECYNELAKMIPVKEAIASVKKHELGNNESSFVLGISRKFNDIYETTGDEYSYLYTFSQYTNYLQNILFHKAIMACFFEKERNEVKLDMLSEVLDIKEWKRISTSA